MATEVKLPDVLEGVQDVTINRWLVKPGDTVKAGQTILEVATEKVDTEVQAPVDGTVLQLNFGEGEIVSVTAALALIGKPDEQVAQSAPARAPEEPAGTQVAEAGVRPMQGDGQAGGKEPAAAQGAETPDEGKSATPVARRVAEEEGVHLADVKGSGPGGQVTKEDVLAYAAQKKGQGAAAPPANGGGAQPGIVTEQKAGGEAPRSPEAGGDERAEMVPLPVQRLAVEYDVDLRALAGDRPLGTLTEADVVNALARQGKQVPEVKQRQPQWQPATAPVQAPAPPAPAAPAPQAAPAKAPAAGQAPRPPAQPGAGEELVPHTRMRSSIARNTAQAAFSIPHVTTMWDVNMSTVLAHRQAHKAEYAAEGVNLTVTAYLVQAAIAGLRAVPAANATWTDEGLILRKYYHIGVAVALPMDAHGLGGLIVPVIKNAGDLSLLGIARAVADLAQRARANKLTADELQGGTFSVSNYGTSGSRFQTPVIVSGQAGILGVGAIEKRPVVVSQGSPLDPNRGDYLAFLPMLTLGFSYDHRILDGATADAFCAAVKDALENWK
jgi:2-oxoisovalerate dehydrogenase E2 component (dihydrolipoyl transacylase)